VWASNQPSSHISKLAAINHPGSKKNINSPNGGRFEGGRRQKTQTKIHMGKGGGYRFQSNTKEKKATRKVFLWEGSFWKLLWSQYLGWPYGVRRRRDCGELTKKKVGEGGKTTTSMSGTARVLEHRKKEAQVKAKSEKKKKGISREPRIFSRKSKGFPRRKWIGEMWNPKRFRSSIIRNLQRATEKYRGL